MKPSSSNCSDKGRFEHACAGITLQYVEPYQTSSIRETEKNHRSIHVVGPWPAPRTLFSRPRTAKTNDRKSHSGIRWPLSATHWDAGCPWGLRWDEIMIMIMNYESIHSIVVYPYLYLQSICL